MTDILTVEAAGPITSLTLNRPAKHNALSRAMLDAIQERVAMTARTETRVIILSGGPKCFSAGADLTELDGSKNDVWFDTCLAGITRALRESPFIAIAAIEGYCIGAALDLVSACDARICSTDVVFELPAIRLGLLYNPDAVARIRQVLPAATMTKLLVLGERILGCDALQAGIATHLVEPHTTQKTAMDLARRLSGMPRAAIETKRFLAALDGGTANMQTWQDIRQQLLDSTERQAAFASAKARLYS